MVYVGIVIDDRTTCRGLRDLQELKGYEMCGNYCILSCDSKRLVELVGYMKTHQTRGLCENYH